MTRLKRGGGRNPRKSALILAMLLLLALFGFFVTFGRVSVSHKLKAQLGSAVQSDNGANESAKCDEHPDGGTDSDAGSDSESSADSFQRQSPPKSKLVTIEERDFYEIAKKSGTDKVAGHTALPKCLKDNNSCTRKDCEREECRPWGHFYDTMYNKWLKPYSTDDAEPFQFLEIGYYNGRGFDAYTQFLPRGEMHSMEISCMEPGPRSEGKWPEKWGNTAIKNKNYDALRDAKRLHCGDASSYDFLHKIWTTEMKRPGSPPLKIVVDDGAHLAEHMATTLFFWIPRIEPGGMLVVEDIQPISEANRFRTHILSQAMKDLHWCGDPKLKDTRCFPTIQPFIQGIHCEMHICVFFRNDNPSIEPDEEASKTPNDAFRNAQKCLFGPH